MNTAKTFCRNCTGVCGLEVEVVDNRITAVRPDRTHPITRGYHCVKAGMSVDLASGAEERLQQSLRRHRDGHFEALSASAALDQVGERLQAIVQRYGGQSVGLYYGTAAYAHSLATPLAKSLMHELGSPYWYSTMTIDQSAIWVTLGRMGYMASGKHAPDEVDTLLLIGSNPVVSHQMGGLYHPVKALNELRSKGAQVIVVDPRLSETARRANLHLPIIAGTDAALLACLVHQVLRAERYDRVFTERHAEGLQALQAAVEGCTPSAVAARTGLPAEQIKACAQALIDGPRALVMAATGASMGPDSNLVLHLVECLNLLCGAVRRAGDRVGNPGVLLPRPWVETAVPPSRTWEQAPKGRHSGAGRIFGEFPTATLPDEILGNGDNPERLRALIVWGGNPLKSLGQPAKTRRAFEQLDLLVTIDPRLNDTARISDFVIAPTLQYERHDLSALMDGFGGYPQPFVQYTEALLQPPPEVIGEDAFFLGLAQRLGLSLTYKKLIAGMGYSDMPGGHAVDPAAPPDVPTLLRWWCEGTAVDVQTLLDQPGEPQLVELPASEVVAVPDSGARLQLLPVDVAAELQAALHARAEPTQAYPYRLATRRLLETLNSAYQEAPFTRRRHPWVAVAMAPDDLAREGIEEDDWVELESAHGRLRARVKADASLRPGTVCVPHLWGSSEAGSDSGEPFSGQLVSLDEGLQSINRMPVQTGLPLRVRPWQEA